MSSSDAGTPSAPRIRNLAHHFDTIEKQDHAARLGMWLFLGTEVLLFAGLFLGYTVYRYFYHEAFHHGVARAGPRRWARSTRSCSSPAASRSRWPYYAVKVGKNKLAVGMLVFTILCACGFLVIKYFEYAHKFHGASCPASGSPTRELIEVPGREPVLHHLLPGHRPARVPRHRRDVGADLGD